MKKLYQNQEQERWTIKKLLFGLVKGLTILAIFINALTIIGLSANNTMKFAEMLGLPPFGAMCLVEVAFALLLILRAWQRAHGLNVPLLLNLGYFGVFCLLTSINVYGLYLINPELGPYGGLAISALMFLFENILVWQFTKSNEPYQKGILKMTLDAMKEAWELRQIQRIKWIKYNARRADPRLVKKVRKTEKKRKKIIGDDLPEFFRYIEKQENIDNIIDELKKTEPKVHVVEDVVESSGIVPVTNTIGFHAEDERRGSRSKKTYLAYQIAKHLYIENNKKDIPSCREIVSYSEKVAKERKSKDFKVSIGTAKAGRDILVQELDS